MSAFHNNSLIGSSGSQGYQISRSVRLRSSASAYFNRTPGSAGNRKTWTWNGWVKKTKIADANGLFLFGAGALADETYIQFTDVDNLMIRQVAGNVEAWKVTTTQVFRDPSAYGMLTIAFDTTQATASNRIKVYWNGLQITAFSSTSYPAQNNDTYVNNNVAHYIGKRPGASAYFDGYLTEVNFIDGQALTPLSFGETNPVTGVWQPKKYAGTYGTNGFYLNFSDNSAATAAAIGKDYSGNGNNWTPNNISVTAGVTYDSMLDVPTPWADGGNGRGNYATLNPLSIYGTNTALANGSLTSTASSSANDRGWPSTIAAPGSGKWYAEFTFTATDAGNNGGCGIMLENGTGAPGESATTVSWRDFGTLRQNASGTSYGSALSANDVVMVAYDAGAGKVWFGKNGTWFASGNPATDTSPSATGVTTTGRFASYHYGVAATIHANFGQRPFAYTPPSGFKALNTQNLPEPTILKGNQYFDATTYTGTSSSQTIVNSGAMQPDLVWTKGRSIAADHFLLDSVRSGANLLIPNATSAEFTGTTYISSFASNGFTIANTSSTGINQSGSTYVAWQWKAGGTPATTNTNGTITSTVSVGATQGFSVVTYNGNQDPNANVGHGLGVAPAMIIVKARGAATSWPVYHQSLGATKWLLLNSTQAATTSSQEWNNIAPTSTTFNLGTSSSNSNQPTTYVAYCFSEVAGYSKFGSYTGNGSADGPFVFTGFRPRFVMFKRTDSTGDWHIYDTARDEYNVMNKELNPNTSIAETTAGGARFDYLSNGFKARGTGAALNASGGTYIFAAFAENPMKYSLAR